MGFILDTLKAAFEVWLNDWFIALLNSIFVIG